MFEKLENHCVPTKSILFVWTKKDFGFGQLYFYVDENDVLHCDNECMSKETVKDILCSMVDNAKFQCERDEKTP